MTRSSSCITDLPIVLGDSVLRITVHYCALLLTVTPIVRVTPLFSYGI